RKLTLRGREHANSQGCGALGCLKFTFDLFSTSQPTQETRMNMKAIRQLAKTLQVDTGQLSKTDLIRKIQLAEGNFDCYGSASSGDCDQLDCAWRSDCLNESAVAATETE
ncbi:hypothetical protein, partial [Rhodoferax sp.]|uniref:hypothetical protein n=2 Tax=Rhodoferax sp. TaxID=50421 RepID=UPI0027337A6E